MPFWMGPATGFIGLIVWSLSVSTDIKEQLKHQGHLVKIIEHVRDIPLETIQGLSEVSQHFFYQLTGIPSRKSPHQHCVHVLQRNKPGSKGRRVQLQSVHVNFHVQVLSTYKEMMNLKMARGGEFSFLGHKMLVCYCFLVFLHGLILFIFIFLLGMHVVLQWVAPVEHKSQCSSKALNKH